MSRYQIFLTLFIVSVLAAVFFFFFYLQAVFGFAFQQDVYSRGHTDPFEFFSTIFSPQVIVTFFLMAGSSLACRIYGIVLVAKNKRVTDGEKALWIVGFVIMGFITAIVFLVMAKGKGFTEQLQ